MNRPATSKDVSDLSRKVGTKNLKEVLKAHIKPARPQRHGKSTTDVHRKRVRTPAASAVQPNGPQTEDLTSITTPNGWFCAQFPELAKRYGGAVSESIDNKGKVVAKNISESFVAATFGTEGSPNEPAIYLPAENRFYQYDPSAGIFEKLTEAAFAEKVSQRLLLCARECQGVDSTRLRFQLRDSGRTDGVIKRSRGVLNVSDDYFVNELQEFLPCANGMLRLDDFALLPFNPSYRRRNKLAAIYTPGADCPRFRETLLRPALNQEDIDLLQRWCGIALTGVNVSQKILMISGTAGGGKGTLIRVITGIIGPSNVASLRPRHLNDRFEIGRYLDKTLLYGPDVAEDFLSVGGASVLKSLTGGDPVTVEFKGSNASPQMTCRFNVVVTCNALPTVRLEGDVEAWRRRLIVLKFSNPQPACPIVDLCKQILANEGAGVLNWMLKGLAKARADGWKLTLSPPQQAAVNNLLAESDAEGEFVQRRLVLEPEALLTVDTAYVAYVAFCKSNGWRECSRRKFGIVIEELVARQWNLNYRHDIPDGCGRAQRGWKGVRCSQSDASDACV